MSGTSVAGTMWKSKRAPHLATSDVEGLLDVAVGCIVRGCWLLP